MGKIERFQTWFFNPANTYSPLAGSAWYAWLLGPIGNDALAVHGQGPMVLLLFLAAVSIGWSLGSTNLAAVFAAVAICLSRPIVNQLDKGKDDLFLVAFFAVAVAAMVGRRRDPLQPWRIGLALGLCLAIKYTALLSLPVLLLMVQRVKLRDVAIAAGCVLAIAGPWYLANWVQFGNPLFPTDFLFFKGLFSTARSAALGSPAGIYEVIVTGPFAVPRWWGVALLIGWAGAFLAQFLFKPDRNRIVFTWGPVFGLGLFLALAPYAEIRFILPTLLLLAMAVHWFPGRQGRFVAGIAAVIAIATCIDPVSFALEFAGVGVVLAVIGVGMVVLQQRIRFSRDRLVLAGSLAVLFIAGYAWVNWRAFVRDRRENAGPLWTKKDMPGALWTFVRDQLPPGETIAYTGTHLVYPLMDGRRVVHVPVRKGVSTIADLTRLGDRLSGQQINPAMQRAMVRDWDAEQWLDRLRGSGAAYVMISADVIGPERSLLAYPKQQSVELIYQDAAGMVFRITWPSPPVSPAPAR
jgi:hypothetical protein